MPATGLHAVSPGSAVTTAAFGSLTAYGKVKVTFVAKVCPCGSKEKTGPENPCGNAGYPPLARPTRIATC